MYSDTVARLVTRLGGVPLAPRANESLEGISAAYTVMRASCDEGWKLFAELWINTLPGTEHGLHNAALSVSKLLMVHAFVSIFHQANMSDVYHIRTGLHPTRMPAILYGRGD